MITFLENYQLSLKKTNKYITFFDKKQKFFKLLTINTTPNIFLCICLLRKDILKNKCTLVIDLALKLNLVFIL